MEILSLHAQARARRRLQVDAPPSRRPGRLHHRARRRLADGQADGGDHRERRRVLLGESCPGSRPGNARGRLPRLLPQPQSALWLQAGEGARRDARAPDPGGRPCGRADCAGHLREFAAGERPEGDMPRPQRAGHHEERQALAEERPLLPAHQRSLYGDRGLGPHGERPEGSRPRAGGGRLGGARLEGTVRQGAAGAAGTGPGEAAAGPGGEQVPAQRLVALRPLWQALHRPGSEERALRLLRLRHPAAGGRGNLRGSVPELGQGGGVHRREDQGPHPHGRDHHGAGDAGGRGGGRSGGGAR